MGMNEVLLTVSGKIDSDIREQIANGARPMADYIKMADTFDADLIDYDQAVEVCGSAGNLIRRFLGRNFTLALACFLLRKKYRVILTDGEQVGIPLAFLSKFFGFMDRNRPRHLMITHILSVGKKMAFFKALRIHSHIDIYFVYSSWQKTFIEENLGEAPENVVFTPFMVDDHFFSKQVAREDIRPTLKLNYPGLPIISAVGLEFRDYPTLIEAVDGLDVQVVIAAASPWSKRTDTTQRTDVPDNVLVRGFTQHELRQVYATSDFCVMPLYHVEFQAGVTALLEAMAMEKAIICTSTPGQTDVIIHDEHGYYVPPEDPETLRHAIQHLLTNPDESRRMGLLGRKRIEEEMSLNRYVERLDEVVRRFTKPAGAGRAKMNGSNGAVDGERFGRNGKVWQGAMPSGQPAND